MIKLDLGALNAAARTFNTTEGDNLVDAIKTYLAHNPAIAAMKRAIEAAELSCSIDGRAACPLCERFAEDQHAEPCPIALAKAHWTEE